MKRRLEPLEALIGATGCPRCRERESDWLRWATTKELREIQAIITRAEAQRKVGAEPASEGAPGEQSCPACSETNAWLSWSPIDERQAVAAILEGAKARMEAGQEVAP